MIHGYLIYVQFITKYNPHLKSNPIWIFFAFLHFCHYNHNGSWLYNIYTIEKKKKKKGFSGQNYFTNWNHPLIMHGHKFTKKKYHFVIPMKQNFESLFYITAEMPMTHLKLIFFNGSIYRTFSSFNNTKDIYTLSKG